MTDEVVQVTFQAQEQVGNRFVNDDKATFEVPLSDALIVDAEGVPSDVEDVVELLPRDDSIESDELALHENAPDWVREWVRDAHGPFYVQVELV